MQKITVSIKGMHCKSCELLIEDNLCQIPGVKKVESSFASGKAKVWFEGKQPSETDIAQAVEAAGYSVGQGNGGSWISTNSRDYYYLVNAGAILLLLFIVAQMLGVTDISANFNQKSIAMAGIVGLIAGVSSCMALIGGLVLALSARHSELHPEVSTLQKFRPHLFFNLGRVLGFALFGGLIGLVGAALQPSPKFLAILTLIVGGVMILLGLKLVEIFPVLDRVTLTLPKSLSRFLGVGKTDKEYSHRGAFTLGALTFFLPCGFTQAMQLYAISTGSFIQGALIMSLFALGTAPGLLGIGGLTSAFKGTKARLFFATAGLAVILLGVFNITNASRLVFPPKGASEEVAGQEDKAPAGTQLLSAKYTVDGGLQPSTFTVKAGQPVRIEVDVLEEDYGCMGSIMIPGLYQKPQFMEKGKKTVMQFTPKKAGNFKITCAMGFRHGSITVQ